MKLARRFTPVGYRLRRGDVLAALLALVMLGGLLLAAARWMPVNHGFGPDWDCTQPGSGDPVCVRKPTR